VTTSIIINEIHPNPITGKEWVELLLTSNEKLDLTNFTLFDSYHQIYQFDGQEEVEEQFILVEVSGLNNDQDSLIVKDAEGDIIDTFSYTGTEKGLSWSREVDTNNFFLSEASPNATNPSPTVSPSAEVTPTVTNTPIVSIIKTPTNPTTTTSPTIETSSDNKIYHAYPLTTLQLETQNDLSSTRASRLVILGQSTGQTAILSAIMGGLLAVASASFLIYAQVKKHH
jgi:hypothetical protein